MLTSLFYRKVLSKSLPDIKILFLHLRNFEKLIRSYKKRKAPYHKAFHIRCAPLFDKIVRKAGLVQFGAGGGTRTHTPLRITDFESVSSTNSNTPAYYRTLLYTIYGCLASVFKRLHPREKYRTVQKPKGSRLGMSTGLQQGLHTSRFQQRGEAERNSRPGRSGRAQTGCLFLFSAASAGAALLGIAQLGELAVGGLHELLEPVLEVGGFGGRSLTESA